MVIVGAERERVDMNHFHANTCAPTTSLSASRRRECTLTRFRPGANASSKRARIRFGDPNHIGINHGRDVRALAINAAHIRPRKYVGYLTVLGIAHHGDAVTDATSLTRASAAPGPGPTPCLGRPGSPASRPLRLDPQETRQSLGVRTIHCGPDGIVREVQQSEPSGSGRSHMSYHRATVNALSRCEWRSGPAGAGPHVHRPYRAIYTCADIHFIAGVLTASISGGRVLH